MAGNFFQAFATGAATTLTENIKREEKNARELAAAQAEMLINNHNKVRDAREKQANKMIDDVDFLSSQFPAISNDDLVMAATNPSAVAALRARAAQPDWNPQTIKFSDFAQLTSTNTGYSVGKLVNDLFDKSVAEKTAEKTAVETKQGLSILQRITAGTQEQELKRIVSPLGYDVDKLKADIGRQLPTPEGKVKFNLGVLATPSYDAELKKAKLDVVKAQEANDPVAFEKASAKVTAFVVAESLTKTETLTNEQIQSNLVTQIQAEKDPAKRTVLEKQLNDRQKLLAADKKVTEADIRTDIANRIIEAKKTNNTEQVTLLTNELKFREKLLDKQETNQEKISAANYMSAAKSGVDSAIRDAMPPGSFVTTINPDGSTSLIPKSLTEGPLYRKGVENGRKAIIAQYTDENGKPKSILHEAALISIGVVFDQNGVARLPSVEGTPPPAKPAPAAPAPAPAPAKTAPAAAPAPKQLPSGTKTATMADVNIFARQQNLTPAQIITELKNKGYRIVD